MFGPLAKEKDEKLGRKSECLFKMRTEAIAIIFLLTNYWKHLYNVILKVILARGSVGWNVVLYTKRLWI